MHKKMFCALTILLTIFIIPIQTFAHANLQGTTPSDGEVVKYALDVITFEFSTDIKEGSQFIVTDEEGQEIDVEAVQIDGNVMLGQTVEPLNSGSYTVKYEIISEDSHVVDGEYSFQVESGEETKDDSETAAPDYEDGDEQTSEEDANQSANQTNPTDERAVEDGLSPTVFIIAGLFILAGIGFLIWVIRKKGQA
ncbi:copper resistance CopC family protein [Pseudalkalibacillus sp. Hm43]|uniref:copper resistance CopC family protein n=1 Tax=Pseudalkalibacillus sp. Hm43 TaxID=3450742 RepID=UPI003F436F34